MGGSRRVERLDTTVEVFLDQPPDRLAESLLAPPCRQAGDPVQQLGSGDRGGRDGSGVERVAPLRDSCVGLGTGRSCLAGSRLQARGPRHLTPPRQIELHATNGHEASVDATAKTARCQRGGQSLFEDAPHLGLHRTPVPRGAHTQASLGVLI